jgi:hypothetical protein
MLLPFIRQGFERGGKSFLSSTPRSWAGINKTDVSGSAHNVIISTPIPDIAHTMINIGGILQENPFYIPPDEFLRELNSTPLYEYEPNSWGPKEADHLIANGTWHNPQEGALSILL